MPINETNDMKPKRGRGRPKGSKEFFQPNEKWKKPPYKTRIVVSNMPLIYRYQRVQWYKDLIEKQLINDPLYIDSKKYLELLKEFQDLQEEMVRLGLHTNEGRKTARKRVQERGLAQNGDGVHPPTVGGGKSSGVGDGVPAPHPFGKSR